MAGLLITGLLAALTYSIMPRQYSSSGTAVLVPAKQGGVLSNPLLSFDAGLNTTALILVQSMSAPQVSERLGLVLGKESFTIQNSGSVPVRTDGSQQPFINVEARSENPGRVAEIVSEVFAMAQQNLADRQKVLQVRTRAAVQLEAVEGPEPAKPVWSATVRAAGLAVVLGLVATVACVCVCDRRAQKRSSAKPMAFQDRERALAW